VDDRGWQTLAWGVAAVLVVLLGVRLLGGSPEPPPVRVSGSDAGSKPAGGSARASGVYVHVAGAVERPDLYRVGDGTRVAAALERAGGPTEDADLDAVNLAAPVQDGQQIVVPERGGVPTAGTSGSGTGANGTRGGTSGNGGAGGGTGVRLSIGAATVEQLEQLDGIGPTLAARIVEHRQAKGGFSSLDQLSEVDGIGEQRLAALKQALSP
jgi:competence protein ComEA